MKKIKTEELRELQMQILDYVDGFCHENNIKYTLSGGTLLGAVRHGGFIPWDDDIDIQMLRSEYNQFVSLWNNKKEHGNYYLVGIESGNNNGCPFGKVCDNRTITISNNVRQTGVFLDVFPVDNIISEEDFRLRYRKIRKLYKKKSIVTEYENRKISHISLFRTLVLLIREPRYSSLELAMQINNIARQYEQSECDYVFEMIAGAKCKEPIAKSVFLDYRRIRFENREYMSVMDVNQYLTCTFGNWRQLPPKEKQMKTHDFIPYWL